MYIKQVSGEGDKDILSSEDKKKDIKTYFANKYSMDIKIAV